MEDAEAREFSKKILTIQEEERHRISRDLHDEIGQFSVSLGSALNVIEKEITKRNLDTALRVIKDAKTLLADTANKIRTLFIDLRPAELDMLGLPSVLRELFSHYTKSYPLNIKFKENIGSIHIKDEVAITLYRVIQEAFNNIVKHAKAKNVKIDLLLKAGEINFTIEDDGIGFNSEEFFREANVDKLGLRGMRERVDLLNGKFFLQSKLRAGTKINVTFPIIEEV
ncbi:MAG: sensor histidine kinase [Candidatus Omnitrophica bacterium]|nr:sensor histidine kinase [Candidatus Omnitrophota bacterium]